VVYGFRSTLATLRENHTDVSTIDCSALITQTSHFLAALCTPTLRRVINATGIILHTNLGRAVLGAQVLEDISPVILGYSNVEFDLAHGIRGSRNSHVTEMLKAITGADNALVVNNNAAALVLILNSLAKDKEVIVSRGELIEIGAEFRLPEIMRASGAIMVEIGTTNKTRLKDYEAALSDKTALIIKVHRSNFTIHGFTEEVSVTQLSHFARTHAIAFLYDIGSGLIQKPDQLSLDAEPDVLTSVAAGVDLVCFSGDKLLGGPQAGIIVGEKKIITRLSTAPLMRCLRIGKLELCALATTLRQHLNTNLLQTKNPTFRLLRQTHNQVKDKALALQAALLEKSIESTLIESVAHVGGGTLPDLRLVSTAILPTLPQHLIGKKGKPADILYQSLLQNTIAVVAILREGKLILDCFTIDQTDVSAIAEALFLGIRNLNADAEVAYS
ncbi:MAG: L-seryl-tRNA(Sec) selenium transferase, partial [Chitinivibrionales bacterium]|nr:L-seryl-tRNA(Sec) selenium transferase [Chitinivibrionales bacterium]